MNFFDNQNSGNSNPAPLNLNKGDILDLSKDAPLAKNVIVGAGWDINKSNGADFDLDISAFLLDSNGRVTNPATQVVYFRQLIQSGIELKGDNRTGAGDGDDEEIHVALDEIPKDIQRIVFNINIYNAIQNKQTFGMVDNSYIRLMDKDNNNRVLCKFELKKKASSATAVTFAELYRTGNGWSFKAIGEGLVVTDLNQLLVKYM